jgi:NADH dehydrogenase FAD-containing subunit
MGSVSVFQLIVIFSFHSCTLQGDNEALVVAPRVFKTNKGRTLEGDLLLRCIPGGANTAALQTQFGRHLNQDTGKVAVNDFLQLPDTHNIFIAGDIIDLPHTGTLANLQGVPAIIVKNIESIVSGNRPSLTFDTEAAFEYGPIVTVGPSMGLCTNDWLCCICSCTCWASSVKAKFHQTLPPAIKKP